MDRPGRTQGLPDPHRVRDLKGKKVAATKGTDAYLFLLRALHDQGLTKTTSSLSIFSMPMAARRSSRTRSMRGRD